MRTYPIKYRTYDVTYRGFMVLWFDKDNGGTYNLSHKENIDPCFFLGRSSYATSTRAVMCQDYGGTDV